MARGTWEKYFFEIAIYRCPQEQHFAELRKRWDKVLWEVFGRFGNTREAARHHYERLEQHLWEKSGGPWEYNQAVGWIRLFVLGSQIRADYYFTAAKRITRSPGPRHFRYELKAFELTFYPEDSNAHILQEIRTEFDRVMKERPFKGRFLDIEAFDNVARYIDWRGLIGFEEAPSASAG